MAVTAIPEGYHSIQPYLVCKGAAKALEFYTHAFGAREFVRMPGPDGRIMHAEMKIGDSPIMLADECPEMQANAPESGKRTAVTMHMYVEKVDAFFDRAVTAGCKVVRPVADQFYGDRAGMLTCPYGHSWYISTHIEDVPPEEMEKRMEEAMKAGKK